MDFRITTLQLYNQDVLIKLKAESEAFTLYGAHLKGAIIGRIWGNSTTADINALFPCDSTVIALRVRTHENEFEISCSDIDSITGVNPDTLAEFDANRSQVSNL